MRTTRSSSRPGGVSARHPTDQVSPQEQTPLGASTPPVDRITDACEIITLPQLRFGR